VAEPFARDEDRAADVEAEDGMLERACVPLPDQEPDQAFIPLVQLGPVAREADAGSVDDGEVARHVRVEPDEAVVEDRDRALG
jgi:hypothetical protein